MRIGIFTDTYKPQVNGVVSSIITLEKELRKKGHKIYIITVTDPDVKKPESNVLRLPSISFRPLPQYRLGMVYSQKVIRRIKALNLDIIHSQTEWGVGTFSRFVAKQLRIPLVHTYHTLYEYYTHYITKGHFNKSSKLIAQKISEFYCNKCNSLIVPTKKVEKILLTYGVTKKMNIIPTGLDVKRFFSDNYTQEEVQLLRQKYHIQDDDFLCLYVGRIAREKSLDVLIKMFSKLEGKKYKLMIVGRGSILDDLKTLAKELNQEERVIFIGEIPYEIVPIYYQIGDVFINASISETQGLTFIEAMAAKIAINARYDENLVDLLIENNAGLLYTDEQSFVDNIKKLEEDKHYLEIIKQNAFEISKKYTAETFGDSVEAVYKKTIEEYGKNENFTLFGRQKFIQQIRSWKSTRASEKGPWAK